MLSYGTHRAKLLREGRLAADDDFICDLDHNASAGRGRCYTSTSATPCSLLTHGCLWSWHKKRPLLACEAARLHTWPWSATECQQFGSVIDLPSMLRDGRLSCRQLSWMLGDAWSLRPQGCFLMWLLSSVRRTRVSICRSPSDPSLRADAIATTPAKKRAKVDDASESPGSFL